MKITDIETIVLRQKDVLPIGDGTQDCLILKVHTDENITGIGEVHTCPTVAQAVINAPLSHAAVAGLKEIVVGEDPFETEHLWEKMYRQTQTFGRRGIVIHALSGVDMALWDIKGKALGLPIYKLLGGSGFKEVAAYASILLPDDSAEVENYVKALVEQGFKAIKLGWGSLTDNIHDSKPLIEKAKAAAGEEVKLMVDIGMGLDLSTAMEMAGWCQALGVYFLEEPLSCDDLSGYAALCDSLEMPIASGEKETTRWGFRDLIIHGHLDILQPDIARCGGISEAKKIVDLCSVHHRQCIPHCWSSDILVAATLQLTASAPGIELLEFCMADTPIRKYLAGQPIRAVNGTVKVPEAPGLGIELNEDFIKSIRQ